MKIGKNLDNSDKKLMHKLFWRSGPMYISVNPVLMGGPGFAYALMPFINKFYKDKKDRAAALERETQYFSTTIPFASFVMGIAASMEKENSENPDFDATSINAIKTGLMGPLAGIGDSLFWGVWRVVCAGIAITLAKQGSFLAPILFLLMFNIPNYLCRYYGGILGYSLGSKYITKIYKNGLIEVLTKAASILGLIMVGAMTVSMVIFKTKINLTMGGKEILNLQSVLDTIFKNIIPVLITLGCFRLLRNKKAGIVTILLGIVVFSVVLSLLGWV